MINVRKLATLYIVIVAILVGLIFVLSGTGKLPMQTEFARALVTSFWTPTLSKSISVVLPWVEVIIGLMLISGVYVKIAAMLALIASIGFMSNNVWALCNSFQQATYCSSCFGIWERFTGLLTPKGALFIDVYIFLSAVLIIIFYPGRFIGLRPWFLRKNRSLGREIQVQAKGGVNRGSQ